MAGFLAAIVCRTAGVCEKIFILQESVQFADLSAYLWYPFLFVGLYFCFTVVGLTVIKCHNFFLHTKTPFCIQS